MDPFVFTSRTFFELVTHLELHLSYVRIFSPGVGNPLLIDITVHAPLTHVSMVVRAAVQAVLLVAHVTMQMPVELVFESARTSICWTPGDLLVQ